MRKFVLHSFALLCFVQANAQPLKIVVQKDQEYKVESSSQMIASTSNGAETYGSSFENSYTYIFKVKDVSKQEIGLKSECTKIVSHTKIMDAEMNYDSDKKDNDERSAKILSKGLGKSKNMVLDLTGKIIKDDLLENTGAGEMDMLWSGIDPTTPLFMPDLIGKELKAGDSIPVATTYFKEKPSTNFSFNKESITTTNTGVFKIISVADGIASVSFTGIQLVKMEMKIEDTPVTTITNYESKMDLRVNMSTGIVISSFITTQTIKKEDSNDPVSMDMKSTMTTKVTLL